LALGGTANIRRLNRALQSATTCISVALKVGSSWSHMSSIETSQGAKIPTRVTASVVSYESVIVPAGTFMAFRTILSLNGRQFLESWWAPETRTAVRSIITNLNQGQIISELVDYQRSDDPAGAF
jgi:hypothetical protein